MTRYESGGTILTENNKKFWIKKEFEYHYTDTVINITPKYNQNPDLVAFDYYGNSVYEWLILSYNNITDPWSQFITGKEIRIPVLSRLQI